MEDSPNPVPLDTSEEDRLWIMARRGVQPLATHTEPVHIAPGIDWPPRTYIYCTRIGPVDVFGPFAATAKHLPEWRYRELDASHSPHIAAPADLASVLKSLIPVN